MPKNTGIRITEVSETGIARELGWQIGDSILSINDNNVEDVLDFVFYESEAALQITIKHRDGSVVLYDIEKDEEDSFGIELEALKIKRCKNNCIFCFIHQQPKGLRKSLYYKDEDYRFSFLHGNFITMSQLTTKDFERIVRLHLSPLYVSIHTTDEKLRAFMLGTQNAIPIIPALKRLISKGINIHTQIVLCPGINDGNHLQKTISDLEKLFPALNSVAIVPVGLTRYRKKLPQLIRVTSKISANLIEAFLTENERWLKKFGKNWCYLSDEFFIIAKQSIPSNKYYDNYPQFENGVGLVRNFIEEWKIQPQINPTIDTRQKNIAVVTGTLFAPVLKNLMRKTFPEYKKSLMIIPVPNRFLGRYISVTGLLTGKDIIKQIQKTASSSINEIFIPEVCFNSDGLTLDDMTIEDISEITNLDVKMI